MILKKRRLFHWFSSKSEVEATWFCLIRWPHKTSSAYPLNSASLSTSFTMDDGEKYGIQINYYSEYFVIPNSSHLPPIPKDQANWPPEAPILASPQKFVDKIWQCLAIVHTHYTVRRFLPPLPWMMARNVVFYTNKVWRIAVKHTGGLSLGLLLPSCRPLFRASLLPPYRAVGTGRAKGSNANQDFGNIRDHLYIM